MRSKRKTYDTVEVKWDDYIAEPATQCVTKHRMVGNIFYQFFRIAGLIISVFVNKLLHGCK